MRNSVFAILSSLPVLLIAATAQASVEISTDATKNMSCSGGVCSPTAKKAVLNVSDLTNMLASDNVKITTGAGAITITVESPFSWTSTHRLTLDAIQNVSFKAPVTVAGTGAVTITTNDGGSGGDLLFFPGASLDFWDLGSSLIINGASYTLEKDIATLAAAITSAKGRGFFAFAQNYDASTQTYNSPPIQYAFQGVLEGLGHTIDKLTMNISESYDVGLFENLTEGTIRDLNLSGVQISVAMGSDDLGIGTLVGRNDGGKIIRSSASGALAVTGSGDLLVGGLEGVGNSETVAWSAANIQITAGSANAFGGLVGWHGSGTVANSSAYGSINATSGEMGGLVGHNEGTITASHSTANVYASQIAGAGGLVGENAGTIDGSSATGNVQSPTGTVGGLAGISSSSGSILNSYSSGAVQLGNGTGPARSSRYPSGVRCDFRAGGLVGWSYSGSTTLNSYATGAVVTTDVSSSCTGGLMGLGGGTISDSYSAGLVTSGAKDRRSRVGGFLGHLSSKSSTNFCYWDIDTSGQAHATGDQGDYGITGLSDAQLKSGLPPGFDPKTWGQKKSINNGYPYLLANPPQ